MATEILMPALSPTMEEGTLARWLRRRATKSRRATSSPRSRPTKAVMEFEAVDEGVLGKILVPEGAEGVKVNTPIALLDGDSAAAAPAAPRRPQGHRRRRCRPRHPPPGRTRAHADPRPRPKSPPAPS